MLAEALQRLIAMLALFDADCSELAERAVTAAFSPTPLLKKGRYLHQDCTPGLPRHSPPPCLIDHWCRQANPTTSFSNKHTGSAATALGTAASTTSTSQLLMAAAPAAPAPEATPLRPLLCIHCHAPAARPCSSSPRAQRRRTRVCASATPPFMCSRWFRLH